MRVGIVLAFTFAMIHVEHDCTDCGVRTSKFPGYMGTHLDRTDVRVMID